MRRFHLLLVSGARIAGPLAALGLACIPASAYAVPEFPREIRRDLSLDYEPPCSICHLKNNTGVGTAGTQLALALREHGLDTSVRASLDAALTQLDDEKVDSDGDDIPDVDELREGTDPNSIAPVSLKSQPPPEWGCSMGTGRAAQHGPGTFAALGAMLVALLLRRRRR